MAPKKESSRSKMTSETGTSASVLKKFDPESFGKDDRFIFNLRFDDRHIIYNFITFIVQLRYFAAFGGVKLTGEKLNNKLCLGDKDAYQNPFMIATLYFEGEYEIDLLIYKPNVYNVGFFMKGKWYLVSDFSRVTNHKYTPSQTLVTLDYESSYSTGCPTNFSFFVFKESIINVFNSCDEHSFENLCVILCETMRSDEILRAISKSLAMDSGVPRQVILNKRHVDIILNWAHTSGVWYLYDLGFHWDPLAIYPQLGVKDAEECAASLALAIKMDKKFEFYIEKLRQLETKREKQRRPIDDIKGFVTTDKWNVRQAS